MINHPCPRESEDRATFPLNAHHILKGEKYA